MREIVKVGNSYSLLLSDDFRKIRQKYSVFESNVSIFYGISGFEQRYLEMPIESEEDTHV